MKKHSTFVRSAVLSAASALLFCCGCLSHKPKELHLTEKDSGKTFEVRTQDLITVTLNSNPTTGYSWKFDKPVDPAVLALCKDEFVPPDSKLIGAGGKRVLKFEAITPGKASISLSYVRPWEHGVKPAELFQVIIYATGKPKSQNEFEEGDEDITPRRGSRGEIRPYKSVRD